MSDNLRQVSSRARQSVIRLKNARLAGIQDCQRDFPLERALPRFGQSPFKEATAGLQPITELSRTDPCKALQRIYLGPIDRTF